MHLHSKRKIGVYLVDVSFGVQYKNQDSILRLNKIILVFGVRAPQMFNWFSLALVISAI